MALLLKSRAKRARLGLLCIVISSSFGILWSVTTNSSITRGDGFPSHALSEATFPVDGKRLLLSKPKKKINLQNLIQNQTQRLMSSKPKNNIMSKKNFIQQKHSIPPKNYPVQKQSKKSLLQKNIGAFVRHNHTNRRGPFRGIGTFSGKNSLKQSAFAHGHKKMKKSLKMLRGQKGSYAIQDEDPNEDAVRAYSRIYQLQGEQQLEELARIYQLALDDWKVMKEGLKARLVGSGGSANKDKESAMRILINGSQVAPGSECDPAEVRSWPNDSRMLSLRSLHLAIPPRVATQLLRPAGLNRFWISKLTDFIKRTKALKRTLEGALERLSIEDTSSKRDKVSGRGKDAAAQPQGISPSGDNKSDENVDEVAKKEEDVQLVKALAYEARQSIEKTIEQLCAQSSKSEMDSESEGSESEASESEASESESSEQESDSSQPSASSSDTPQQPVTSKHNSIEPMQGLPRVSAGELEWNEVVYSTRQRGRQNHEDMSNSKWTNGRQHSQRRSQIPKLNVSRPLAATNSVSKLTKFGINQSHAKPIAEKTDSSEERDSGEKENFQQRFDQLTLEADSDDKVNHEHGSGENFQRSNDTNSEVDLLSSENESGSVDLEEERYQQTDRQLQALSKGVSAEYYNFDSVFLIFFCGIEDQESLIARNVLAINL